MQSLPLDALLALEPLQATLPLAGPRNTLGYQPAGGLPQLSAHVAVRGRSNLPGAANKRAPDVAAVACVTFAEDAEVRLRLERWAARCRAASRAPRAHDPWACSSEGMAYCRTRFVGAVRPPSQLLERCSALQQHEGISRQVSAGHGCTPFPARHTCSCSFSVMPMNTQRRYPGPTAPGCKHARDDPNWNT